MSFCGLPFVLKIPFLENHCNGSLGADKSTDTAALAIIAVDDNSSHFRSAGNAEIRAEQTTDLTLVAFTLLNERFLRASSNHEVDPTFLEFRGTPWSRSDLSAESVNPQSKSPLHGLEIDVSKTFGNVI